MAGGPQQILLPEQPPVFGTQVLEPQLVTKSAQTKLKQLPELHSLAWLHSLPFGSKGRQTPLSHLSDVPHAVHGAPLRPHCCLAPPATQAPAAQHWSTAHPQQALSAPPGQELLRTLPAQSMVLQNVAPVKTAPAHPEECRSALVRLALVKLARRSCDE
jgi:hypothetical protein